MNFSKKRIGYSIPTDDSQRDYREHFGIIDKYCIQVEYGIENGEKTGYIVYIDRDNDIDWIDLRGDEYWSDEELKERDKWIAKLNVVHCQPYKNLSERDILDFKKILGAGYVLSLKKQFDDIQDVLDTALSFVKVRNKECARMLYLEISGIVAIVTMVLWILDSQYWLWNKEWVAGTCMGVLGAYVSVWIRYGKVDMTGLSSKWLHYLESVSRLCIGAIFAIVAMHAIKCGIIFSNVRPEILRFAFALTGFAAGFSERFVPSMIEHFVKSNTQNE